MPFIGPGNFVTKLRAGGVSLVASIVNAFTSRVQADSGTLEATTCVQTTLEGWNSKNLLASASWVFIPSGYKARVAYAQVPSAGGADLTWSRGGVANRTQSNGNIGSVAANVPRLSYMYGSCPAALLEPLRTNLDPTSQSFGGAWSLTNSGGVSVSNVSATNPFGFSSVSKVIPSTTLGQHRPLLVANYSAVGRWWVIAKADGYNYLSLGEGGGVSGGNIIFNLSNGTISGAATGITGEITSLGDGWYRCSINTSSGSLARFVIIRNNNTTADYSGDGTSGVLIAHKQMEVGAFDTTAIFTTGVTATRLGDSFTRTNIYTNGLIGVNGGIWYIELTNSVIYLRENSQASIFINTGTSGNGGNGISIRNAGTSRYGIWSIDPINGLVQRYIINTDNTKLALRWDGVNCEIFINGSKVTLLTGGTSFPFTSTTMQNLYGGTANIQQPTFLQAMALWNEPKSDQFCIDLTT